MNTPARLDPGALLEQSATRSVPDDQSKPGELRPGAYIHYGKYRIEGVLGRGSFAVVYAGTHVALRRKVAIKIVHLNAEMAKGTVQRFQQEARTASLVRHPNVLETYDSGTLPGGSPFLVVERVDGVTLASLLRRGQLAIPLAIDVGRQLARGLSAISQAGVVHRDIKPENVMVHVAADAEPIVKIVDFGVSKQLAAQAVGLTMQGELIGTPQYMSPEQLRGEEIDSRADVYALGAVLYEAVTGRPPHERRNLGDLMVAVLSEEIPAPRALRPDCPPLLEQVLTKALARDRNERFSPNDLLKALDAIVAADVVRSADPSVGAHLASAPAPASGPSLPSQAAPPSAAPRSATGASTFPPIMFPPSAPVTSPLAPSSLAPSPLAPSPLAPSPLAPSPLAPSPTGESNFPHAPSASEPLPSDYPPPHEKPRAGRARALRLTGYGLAAFAVAALAFWPAVDENEQPSIRRKPPPLPTAQLDRASAESAAQPPPPERGSEPTARAPTPRAQTPAAQAGQRRAAPSSEPSRAQGRARPPTPVRDRPAAAAMGGRATASEARPAASAPPALPKAVGEIAPENPYRDEPSTRARSADRPDLVENRWEGTMRGALAHLASGRAREALQLYREAARIDPSAAASWRGVALSAARIGDREEAQRAIDKYRALYPGAPDLDSIAARIEELPAR